jgi:outer membrane beta-barrel protein
LAPLRLLGALTAAIVLVGSALPTPAFAADASDEDDGGEDLSISSSVDSTEGGACVDQELADKLAAKRRRRGRVPRDFVKAQRHEVSIQGGYFASDLFSGTYVYGGSYTFHMTEDAAVEASVAYTHADADVVRSIEDGRATVVDQVFAPMTFLSSTLLWYPVHGKLRFGGSILHFDIHLDAGVGVVDSPTSRGAAGIGGLGVKLYGGQAFAFRMDVRDHVYRQELLDKHFLVNDVSVTAGMSIFLPLGF